VYFVYLLECKDGSIYTGITTDIVRRFSQHQRGTGSHFTRARKAKRIIYTEKHIDRSEAQKCEAIIKKFSHKKKLDLAAQAAL